METTAYKISVLTDLFDIMAHTEDVSLQMNAERGGLFIQCSARDWDKHEIETLLEDFPAGNKLKITTNTSRHFEGPLSFSISFKEDTIR